MSHNPVPSNENLIRRMRRLLGEQIADMEKRRRLPPLTHPRSTAARRRRKDKRP